jgi:RNA polymerase sigma-70 factor (sigma-E family)
MEGIAMADEDVTELQPDLARSYAIEALYRKHYVAMATTARLLIGSREEGEEIAQDAFVALYQGWDRLRDKEFSVPYLRASVVNLARGRMRRASLARRHPPPVELPADPPEPCPGTQELAALRGALNSLPARQREAVVLRFFAGLGEAEIAAAMGISTGALKSHLHRAKTALGQKLEAYRS